MLERPISKAGWTRVAFGDVVRLSKARVADPEAAGIERVVGLEHIEPGDLRIRRWGDVADGTTFTTLFKPGQVLFGKRRAYQRKVAVADFEGVCSGDIYVLEPANDRLMPELLPFLCQTDAFFDHAVGTSAGSLSPRTNWTSLASFEFLLPPIQQQARLVEAITASDEVVEESRKLVDALQMLLRRVRADSMSDGEIFRLDEVCTLRGGSGFKPSAQGQSEGAIPFIKVSDMERAGNERYIVSAANYVSNETARELRATVFPADATVFAKVGEALRQNRRRILTRETCIDNNMMAAIPNQSVVLPEFLFLVLLEIDFGELVQEGTVPSVNQATLGACEVLLPAITEQREIVDRVNEVETRLLRAKERIGELKALRAQIIDRGFDDV